MSFLGLSDSSSSSSPSYLLDDEEEAERSVAWGRILFVLILLGAAGGLGWQYHVHGYPFGPRTQGQTAATPAAPANPAPAPTDSSASPATPTPAASTETPAAPDANKPTEPAASTPAETTESTPPAAAKTEATPAETKPAAPAPAEKAEAVPEKTAPLQKAEKVAPVRPKTPPPAPEPAVSPGESLYIQGQRYLYGNGVPANCDLAVKSLLSSAARANSKAQSTLGAMYSTGHCVTRDLPTAYRWFAKALHQDPNNTRLEQDLSVVWKQMTPGERQSATKSD
jgi:outer membrane biosynthesis protein TonB